jgi:hypothetical protein
LALDRTLLRWEKHLETGTPICHSPAKNPAASPPEQPQRLPYSLSVHWAAISAQTTVPTRLCQACCHRLVAVRLIDNLHASPPRLMLLLTLYLLDPEVSSHHTLSAFHSDLVTDRKAGVLVPD